MSDVNKEIGLYPMSGDVVRFVSTAKLPIGGFETELQPIQDLHGQEYPWPAGGGKNKFDCNAVTWKKWQLSSNAFKVCADNYPLINVTVNSSDSVTVVSSDSYKGIGFEIPSNVSISVFSQSESVASEIKLFDSYADNATALNGSAVSCTIPAGTSGFVGIRFNSSGTYNLKFQLEDGSFATAWTPYSNICPITGRDSMNIYVSPTPEITDETKVHTIEFPVQGKNLLSYTPVRITQYPPFDDERVTLLKKDTTYTFSFGNITDATTWRTAIRLYNIDGSVLYTGEDITSNVWQPNSSGQYYVNGGNTNSKSVKFTVNSDCYGTIMFLLGDTTPSSVMENAQLEIGEQASSYEPYKGRTVYAGTLTINEDGSGQIISTSIRIDPKTCNVVYQSANGLFYTILNLPARAADDYTTASFDYPLSNMFRKGSGVVLGRCYITNAGNNLVYVHTDQTLNTKAKMDAWLSENTLQFWYRLRDPITIDLTVEQIETLIGFNYVWNNVGTTNITFQYYTGGEGMAITFLDCWTYPKAKLDEMFKAVDDRLDALEEASTQASADSNAKTTTIEPKEIATEPVAEREGDE